VTFQEAQFEAARRWVAMAEDALNVARRETKTGPAAAVNRAYYACFYAATAALVFEGHKFVKHSGVRSAVHKNFIKTGRLSASVGQMYDDLMKSRVEADYQAIIRCTARTRRKP
jgi:uncharacterized protein (UPF0332 family)